ncbi:MAG TPA: redoxin domain-containing protein [Solirubrobacteraceae bacterium]|nr:redoxin domain-containing protein [Solirubrobacteraceae bacterium]
MNIRSADYSKRRYDRNIATCGKASHPALCDRGRLILSAVRDLVGQRLPAVCLQDFNGDPVDLERIAVGWVVYYFYPGTTDPVADGRDGPTEDASQHRAFSTHQDAFGERHVRTIGVSSQRQREQLNTVVEHRISHGMLVDPSLILAHKLELPTFELGERRWYRRLTLITQDRIVRQVFYPLASAARNPEQIFAWLQLRG